MSCWLALVVAIAGEVPDKAALYGDAALVPTRAGERAREELALAAAVAAAVGARADGGAPVVEVRLPAGEDGGAVVVTGAVALAPAEVVAIAEAVVGSWSVGRVAVFVRAGAPDPGEGGQNGPRGEGLGPEGRAADRGPEGRAVDWSLALALVGFGASAGIAVDRLRRRARQGGEALLYATRR